jgi:hypothetical protein
MEDSAMVNVLLGWLAFCVVGGAIGAIAFLWWVGPNDEMDSDRDGDTRE